MPIEVFGANRVLDQFLGTGTPSNVEIALSVTDPASSFTEPSHASYSRVVITNNSSTWGEADSGEKRTLVEILFDPASGEWGSIRGLGIYDPDESERLISGRVTPIRRVRDGHRPRFAAGSIVVIAQ